MAGPWSMARTVAAPTVTTQAADAANTRPGRGTPANPERVSLVLERPAADVVESGGWDAYTVILNPKVNGRS